MLSKLLTQIRTYLPVYPRDFGAGRLLNSSLLTFLLPPHCISCGQQGTYLCKTCKKRLNPHPEICPYCHRFSPHYTSCLDCKTQQEHYLEGIIIPFSYEEEIKRMILKVKYFHKKDMVNFLAERLNIAIHINQPIISQREKIIISYVPSHRWRRIFIKGYNQSQLLAQALAQQIQRPCLSLVTKNKHTRSQAKLNRAQRQKNLQNVFTLCKTLALKGDETILIADDVATTGATLNTIAKTIKSQYPKIKVWGIVLCRHTG